MGRQDRSGFPQSAADNRAYLVCIDPAGSRIKELKMTPEEIVADLNAKNRDTLYARNDYLKLTHDQVLSLMDSAAMQGFKLGSNVALSMVKGALLVQLTRAVGAKADKS